MTISSTVRIAGPFIGTSTATVFPFAFKIFAASNLQVVRADSSTGLESTLILNTDYTVSLNTDQDSNPGGNVTLLAVLATGFTMVITSDIANLQPTDLTNQGGFYPEVITDALDRATIQIQQMADELTRSIKIPISDGLSLDMELPTAAARANSFLAFDATGEPTVVTAGSSGAPTSITRQQFSGTGSQVAFTLASDPGALGNSCEVFVGGIYQQRDTYTIAGTTLTFSAAPVAGTDNIEVVNFLTSAIGTTDSSLVTFVPAGTSATMRTAQAKMRDVVSVKDFGAVGDGVANDTTAFVNAFATGKATYAPAGTYLVSILNMPSNTFLFGDGAATVIKPLTPTVRCALGADSGSSSAYIENITIRDVRFLGTVAADGFSEQTHLTAFNGVKNMLIENCDFVGFRGDGLYLGSGYPGVLERHNINVTIRSCFFDGINNDNRNAISVIDGNGVLIENNYFTRTTRFNMPGAIDVEPNGYTFAVVKDIKIINNKFDNIGGNVACISVYLPAANNYTEPFCGFLIDKNFIQNCVGTGYCILYSPTMTGGVTEMMPNQSVKITNNVCIDNPSGKSFGIMNCKEGIVSNNSFIRGGAFSSIGSTGSNINNIDLLINGNQFIESGYVSGHGLFIFKCTRISITNNLFKDCGTGVVALSDAINFNANTSSYISITNNVFTTPNSKTLVVIQKNAAHTFTPETNKFIGNTVTFIGTNNFAAETSDTIETSYSPVITGSTTSGAGVYTLQYGRYRKLGTLVFFKIKIAVNAGHTGTGTIQIGLPTLVAAATGNAETIVSISVDGATTTGGQIGWINPGLVVNSLGAIRCIHTATGTLASTTIPAGAFTVQASGCYQST